MVESTISVVDSKALLPLFGARDQHLRKVRDALAVRIFTQGDTIHVEGEGPAVAQATQVLTEMQKHVQRYGNIDPDEVNRMLALAQGDPAVVDQPPLEATSGGRRVAPRTPGQAEYLARIVDHEVVFCVGPAGTGKTYLAVAAAVSALRQERIRKIVLVRPAVEAGESLGYLPGTMHEKINPYLRPLLDALREMMDYDLIKRYMDQDVIEVIPLAYMRGRTLNDSFIILDEAQNATVGQMKMFLTRMGRGSRMVISGDTTQIDLPQKSLSGLNDAIRRLQNIHGIACVFLSGADIVRHRLVTEIVRAYEDDDPPTRPKRGR
ncbi:MAG: PhoH family protein [Pirellulales bacterium]|nr:PhoH family protein [Pirellulales bacterium]